MWWQLSSIEFAYKCSAIKSSSALCHSSFDEERPEVPMLFRDVPSLLIIFVLTMPQPLRKGTAPSVCIMTPLESGESLSGCSARTTPLSVVIRAECRTEAFHISYRCSCCCCFDCEDQREATLAMGGLQFHLPLIFDSSLHFFHFRALQQNVKTLPDTLQSRFMGEESQQADHLIDDWIGLTAGRDREDFCSTTKMGFSGKNPLMETVNIIIRYCLVS